MRKGIRIGKIFGINIRVDWSWLLIFLLVTWNIATSFGNIHSDWSVVLRWTMGVLAALLFFASVLAHELAHSLVAQRQGVEVGSITLFMFGGVSNIQREPESPGNEFWMAILGPLTSFVIGVVLLLIVGVTAGMQSLQTTDPQEILAQFNPLTTIFVWLGSINITLSIFNLIPGFPLDGGRVLRSIFWAITDDLRKATRWASWAGQGIAWMMIVAGISMTFGARIPFFGQGVGSGLWLAFIGWFLSNASSRSYRRLVIQDILEDVPVSRMMREHPPSVAADMSVAALIEEHIMRSDDQGFPVVEDGGGEGGEGGQLLGLVTLDDVRAAPSDARASTQVREIMTPKDDLVTVTPDDDAGDALMELAQMDVRQLPVLRDQQVVGLVRRRDIVKWLQLHSELNL